MHQNIAVILQQLRYSKISFIVLIPGRIRRFVADVRTWGCLACMAVIVVAAIILIILAATGVLSANRD